MPTTEQRKKKLIEKLKELFQLDQPELDFGFYKIMHAKSKQVSEFLEKDLLNIISGSFETVDEAKRVKLREQYEAALKQAREYGAPDPENTPAVKKARTALEGALSSADVEADIYDHLFRFFERYYESGDFTSRRYYARETADKAAPFAIPYNGEEVKLVWANYDQYYIKTSEYFTNYTFDLNNVDEVTARRSEDNNTLFGAQNENKPLRVHFKIIDAAEGEHGNIKAADNAKRFFIPHKKNPVEIDENNELNIFFEYRPDPDKTGQEGMWQKKLNEDAVKLIIDALKDKFSKNDFIEYLKIPAPTETQKDRILLEKYLTKYTTRNTSDYFIHKNLKEFLNRELDFYIKNEVMWLDDIEDADAPQVETYLAKIKVIRKIAHKIIE
ncbi:MAG TPA: site-specific DNA-methyltransferase, partial [Candidatus Wallbacteria bacterium]|nr:site-specific DNA-methyltransferase [Candidatus Wallbacteria bacterium]